MNLWANLTSYRGSLTYLLTIDCPIQVRGRETRGALTSNIQYRASVVFRPHPKKTRGALRLLCNNEDLSITSTAKFLWAAQTKIGTAYKLMELNASSSYTSCKLRELHTSSWTCMQAFVTSCKLVSLHACMMLLEGWCQYKRMGHGRSLITWMAK